jgi:hypothetical protein
MISAGSFWNKWKYFYPLLGVGRAVASCASAVFGKKGGHDAYGYVCFGDVGGGGNGVGHPGVAAVVKESVLYAKTVMLC